MATIQYPNRGPRAEPDAGIADLVRRLTDDSKRLARDEVRLAKLELSADLQTGARASTYLVVTLGAGVVALVALTVCVIALLTLLVGRVWIAAIATGAIELIAGLVFVRRGVRTLSTVPYTFPDRAESHQAADPRAVGHRAD